MTESMVKVGTPENNAERLALNLVRFVGFCATKTAKHTVFYSAKK